MKLQDIAQIKGLNQTVITQKRLSNGQFESKSYSMEGWNPLLIAVAQQNVQLVQMIGEQVKGFHKVNCLSKQYSLEEQKQKVFDQKKRMKRECFALKLAIRNRDSEMFKVIWNGKFGDSMKSGVQLLWNLGHALVCLKEIVKMEWESGLRLFLGSATTKVLFMSVNNSAQDFLSVIHALSKDFLLYTQIAPIFTLKKLKPSLLSPPYYLYGYFLTLTSPTPDLKYLSKCLSNLTQDDLQLTTAQLSEVFDICAAEHTDIKLNALIRHQKKLLLDRLNPERDDNVQDGMEQLAKLLKEKPSNGQIADRCKEIIEQIDELDLFAFTNALNINGRKTNVIQEAMNLGLIPVIDYALNEDQVNIRALLKRNNIYEVNNEIAFYDLGFFVKHLHREDTFMKLYSDIIDILQLSSFIEVFSSLFQRQVTDCSNPQHQANYDQSLSLFDLILNDSKFKSLFVSSLEFQKYMFITDILKLVAQPTEAMKQKPYSKYVKQIQNGQNGEEYCKKTMDFIMQANFDQLEPLNLSASYCESSFDRIQLQNKQSQGLYDNSPRGGVENYKTNNQSNKRLKPHNEKLKTDIQLLSPGNSSSIDSEQDAELQRTLRKPSKFSNLKEELKVKTMSNYDLTGRLQGIGKALNADFGNTIKELKGTNETFRQEFNKSPPKEGDESPDDERMIQSFQSMLKNDDSSMPQLFKKAPQVSGEIKISFQKTITQSNQSSRQINYETVFQQILDIILSNNIEELKTLLKRTHIKNIANLRNTTSITKLPKPDSHEFYDCTLWNPLHFCIYYSRCDILKWLLFDCTVNPLLALREPPFNDYLEYITPQKGQSDIYTYIDDQGKKQVIQLNGFINDQSLCIETENATPGGGRMVMLKHQSSLTPNNGDQSVVISPLKRGQDCHYCPSESKVQCFGLEMAIRNRDANCFKLLWNDLYEVWEEKHFAFLFDSILQIKWDIGLKLLFRSKTAILIYRTLNPEDKDNFLFTKIVDKLTDQEYWARNAIHPVKITQEQILKVVTELSFDPYGSYAVLRFPQLFYENNLLENTLKKVLEDDIRDYVLARKGENVMHLQNFLKQLQKMSSTQSSTQQHKHQQAISSLEKIVQSAQRILLINQKSHEDYHSKSENIVKLIKLGDNAGLKTYLEKQEDILIIEKLNLLAGFSDPDYPKMYQSHVKYEPTDEIMKLIVTENTTVHWNPLIFTIFYQKFEMLQYLCSSPMIYLRSCLVKPFMIEAQESDADFDNLQDNDDEKFIQEKSELFPLVLCVMLQNRHIFKYLLKRCAFLWTDLHLGLLTSFLFEASWTDGLKSLFTSPTTAQIFHSMNLFEKEKYLKFCESSISKHPTLQHDIRYLMSFEPYNAYYLPMICPLQDLVSYHKGEMTMESNIEVFFKTTLINFDERAYYQVKRYNKDYIQDFVGISKTYQTTSKAKALMNFANKVERYTNAPVEHIVVTNFGQSPALGELRKFSPMAPSE